MESYRTGYYSARDRKEINEKWDAFIGELVETVQIPTYLTTEEKNQVLASLHQIITQPHLPVLKLPTLPKKKGPLPVRVKVEMLES